MYPRVVRTSIIIMLAMALCCLAQPTTLPATRAILVTDYLNERKFPNCWKIITLWQQTSGDVKIVILQELEDHLSDLNTMEVENFDDTVILPRARKKGIIRGFGHGAILQQDIFIRGGKAAWAIEELLGLQLPPITEKMPKEDLDRIVREAKNCIAAYARGLRDAVGAENQKQKGDH